MGFLRTLSSISVTSVLLLAVGSASSSPADDRLTSGSATKDGATLVAGNQGASYDLRGGAHIDLSAGTEFSFEPSMNLKLGAPGEPETLARAVRLAKGRIDIALPDRAKNQTAVLVRGPGKLNSVSKEGRATFLIGADDRQTVASRKGDMLVGVGNEWKTLHEGFARTLSPQDPSALPRPILAAPAAKVDHALAIVEGNAGAQVSTSWAGAKDAAQYEVDVQTDGASASAARTQTTSGSSASFDALPPGGYTVTVAAIDRFGLIGVPTAPIPVRVVGVEMPDGATMDDGVVQLGRDQRVLLTGARGLQVSYGSSKLYVDAPPSLGLAHNEATTARLRIANSTEEVSLKLEPVGLRAHVDIGPHVARWPADHVTIRVELYDATGRAVQDGTKVEEKVTVNMAPVALNWTRSGQVLTASLTAPSVPGPWVVRAEVRNERGDLIGRDFLEVARIERPATTGTLANR